MRPMIRKLLDALFYPGEIGITYNGAPLLTKLVKLSVSHDNNRGESEVVMLLRPVGENTLERFRENCGKVKFTVLLPNSRFPDSFEGHAVATENEGEFELTFTVAH